MQNSDEERRNEERRKMGRRVHRGYGTLQTQNGSTPAHLINLSYEGSLIALLNDHELSEGEEVTLIIDLSDGNSLTTSGTVAHARDHFVGLETTPASKDHAKRLQEVIEYLEMLA